MSRCASLLLAVLLAACSTDDERRPLLGETASDRIELVLESDEPVTSILVREGERLDAGTAMLVQDTRRADARLAEAEAAVLEARARLDELQRGPRKEQIVRARASLTGAERDLDFRRTELERITNIRERGLTSLDAVDQARALFDDAEARLRVRRAELEELLAGTTLEELTQAEQAVKRLEARRDTVAIDLERLTLKAPAAGVVDSRLIDAGERPVAGRPAFVMLSGRQAYTRVFVAEDLRAGVSPGDAVTIRIDGIAGPIDGRVRHVASEPVFTPYYALTEHDRGHLSYEAIVDIVTELDRLPDGVPVQVYLHGEPGS